jgi:hypothetical protein
MPCPSCGNSVLFGGVKDGNRRYCSKKCYQADEISRVAEAVPADTVAKLAKDLHGGKCPRCQSRGKIDIHKSYSVYSVVLYTKWQTHEHLLCKSCASRQQLTDLIGSSLLGWWGIPFGLIVTPVQIVKNLVALARNPATNGPSKSLQHRARLLLAARKINSAA